MLKTETFLSRSSRKYILALSVVAVLVSSNSAWGQAFVNGAITGIVTDNSGALVPDADLVLTNLGTNVKISSRSGADGFYQFPNLPPAQYRLDVEKTGFSHFTRETVQVLVNSTVRIDITLSVGAVSETVSVRAETPLLQAETSSLGQVIEARPVNELPLNGRNPMALVSLAPGVVPQGQSGQNLVTVNLWSAGNFQINGGAANQSAAYWDGAPINSNGLGNLLSMIPTQDALQEFKVQTSALPAQYDRFAGGIINFTTKTGTNELHGSAYEYLRNKVLNANNFFNNASGISVPPFTQNQFGATLGGPLVIPRVYNGRNKTFLFASYDGFRLRSGLASLFTVPTVAMRQGDFSGLVDASGRQIPLYDPTTTRADPANPGMYIRDRISCGGMLNVICPSRIDPTARILANLWGQPNRPGQQNGLVQNWAGNASQGGNMNSFTIRGDQYISDKQRIFARYSINKYFNLAIDPFGTHAYPLAVGTPENRMMQQAVLNDSYSFSPTTVLDVSLSYLRDNFQRVPESTGFDLSTLGPGWAPLNDQVEFRTLPVLAVAGITDFSSQNTGSTIKDVNDDWALLPNLTMVRGRHTIKLGGDFRLMRFYYGQTNIPSGYFSFNPGLTQASPFNASGGFGFASFMLGYPGSGSLGYVNLVAAQQIYRAFYVMDDFRATRKLTFNLGFRYSQDGPFSERFDRISTFQNTPNPLLANTRLPANGTLVLVNTPERPSRNGFDRDNKQFSPRVGLAYQITPNAVIRSGYGLFWLPNNVSWYARNPAVDPINSYSTPMISSIDGGLTPYNTLSNPFPNGILPAPGRDPKYATITIGQGLGTQMATQPFAYAQQWNFDIQYTLKGGVFVDAAYSGAKGTHLAMYSAQQNQLSDQYLSMQSSLVTPVPNPYAGIITAGSLSAATVPAGQLLRPYPHFAGVSIPANKGNSTYHSFQLKVQKRFSNGQSLLVSYTNSKFITDTETLTSWLEATGPGGIQNWNNLRAERSLSSYDVPQRLVVSYVLDLPVGRGRYFLSDAEGFTNKLVSGWGIQGVTTLQKGFPISVSTASNLTSSFGGGSRPNYDLSGPGCAQGAALESSPQSRLNQWFNTACFSQPPAFTFGDVSRTLPNVRWDGLSNFDVALIKNTSFGPEDRLNIQFRAEFFNLLNQPQFGPPGSVYGTPTFGVVSSQANSPRLIQFGLKFGF